MAHTEIATMMDSASECCREHACEDAIKLLEAVAQLDPTNAAIQYYLGLCYSGGCQQHALADVQIAHVHLSKALCLLGATADRCDRAKVLGALGNTYAASRHIPLKARLLAAIECHEQAALLFHSEGRLDDWAREEFNLGNAFSELPEEGVLNKWEEAIRHYENALQVRTREKDPDAHAGTLQNLGIAYRELPAGDRAENIKRSILCYRRVLQVRRRWSHPRGYAVVQNNVGNSFMSLAEVEKFKAARHTQRALCHYDRALALYSEEDMPGEYAMALFNRGQGLLRGVLDRPNPESSLRESYACFKEAAKYFARLNHVELLHKSREYLKRISMALDAYGGCETAVQEEIPALTTE